eukprot:2816585-Pleurochrysis_carterae.AAC.2
MGCRIAGELLLLRITACDQCTHARGRARMTCRLVARAVAAARVWPRVLPCVEQVFDELRVLGEQMGFRYVASGPMVRSSYKVRAVPRLHFRRTHLELA